MQHLGFVGLGMMGGPMAANLVSRGLQVTAYDVRHEAVGALAALGARGASDLADLRACDAVIVMVNTDAQAREVISRLIELLRDKPKPIASMSTILPSTIRELGAAAERAGIGLLDAPVSGGVILAQMGALAIMAGGDKGLFEEFLPAFEAIGNTITHVGPLGMGLTVKLVNNLIGITTVPLVLEALRIGLAQGLDVDTMVSVIRASSGNTWLTQNWDQALMFLNFMAADPPQLDALVHTGLKDLQLAETMCAEAGVDAPMLRLITETLGNLGPDALRANVQEVLQSA